MKEFIVTCNIKEVEKEVRVCEVYLEDEAYELRYDTSDKYNNHITMYPKDSEDYIDVYRGSNLTMGGSQLAVDRIVAYLYSSIALLGDLQSRASKIKISETSVSHLALFLEECLNVKPYMYQSVKVNKIEGKYEYNVAYTFGGLIQSHNTLVLTDNDELIFKDVLLKSCIVELPEHITNFYQLALFSSLNKHIIEIELRDYVDRMVRLNIDIPEINRGDIYLSCQY